MLEDQLHDRIEKEPDSDGRQLIKVEDYKSDEHGVLNNKLECVAGMISASRPAGTAVSCAHLEHH